MSDQELDEVQPVFEALAKNGTWPEDSFVEIYLGSVFGDSTLSEYSLGNALCKRYGSKQTFLTLATKAYPHLLKHHLTFIETQIFAIETTVNQIIQGAKLTGHEYPVQELALKRRDAYLRATRKAVEELKKPKSPFKQPYTNVLASAHIADVDLTEFDPNLDGPALVRTSYALDSDIPGARENGEKLIEMYQEHNDLLNHHLT